jgi:hypothetical protein
MHEEEAFYLVYNQNEKNNLFPLLPGLRYQ